MTNRNICLNCVSPIIINKPTTIENQTYKLNNPLLIEEGGSLTLRNMTMLLGDGVPYITVNPGGALYVYNSTITPERPEYGGWSFPVMPDSTLAIQDSEIYGVGRWPSAGDWASIYILTPDVLIQNSLIADSSGGVELRAEGGEIIGNSFLECGSCLMVINSFDVYVKENTIDKSLWEGMWVENVDGGSFMNNTVTHVSRVGIRFGSSNGVTFSGNVISNSLLDGWLVETCGWILFENNHLEGIQRRTWDIRDCWENVITGNTITDSYSALALRDTARDNMIYHNNFSPTSQQCTDEGIGNQWDNGTEGNYWTDYTGVDADGDGIGDTPYYIVPNGVDHYPLMEPYGGASLLTQRRD